MSTDEQRPSGNRIAPQVGGTSTPIAGSKDGTGEKDPVMSEEAGQDVERTDENERT